MRYDAGAGFGNILIHMSDFLLNCCVEEFAPVLSKEYPAVHGIPIGTSRFIYDPAIYINDYTIRRTHPLMRQFVQCPPSIQDILNKLSPYDYAMHIRRGKYQTDSSTICHDDDSAFFCNDVALQKFKNILDEALSKKVSVFLATDSADLKLELVAKYPNIITFKYTEKTFLSIPENLKDNNMAPLLLDWFALGRAKTVFVTAGRDNLKGFSTFGYTAAIYGGCHQQWINNSSHPSTSPPSATPSSTPSTAADK